LSVMSEVSSNKLYCKYAELLAKSNTTTYEVSRKTGISASTFSDWKNDKYTPKFNKIRKIAEYFGVSVAYFMED